MRVSVTAEARYERTPDGSVWTAGGPAYQFWRRYLGAFDSVQLITRVRHVDQVVPGSIRVDGPDVAVFSLPYYVGLAGYLRHRRAVAAAALGAIAPDDAVVLRVPSPLASAVCRDFRRAGRPFALEVVGDPDDMFAPGVIEHPLRGVIRFLMASALRRQCSQASVVAYVTELALQRRYPARPGGAFACSDVDLPDEAFVDSARTYQSGRRIKLVSLGAVERPHKGIDDLLTAVALLRGRGVEVQHEHLGGGLLLPALEKQARRLKISESVTLAGPISGAAGVRERLDRADMFVFPSRAEGLPRALAEAMARGLPCIATRVGGIPELLPRESLVRPSDPVALADAIERAIGDPETLSRWSRTNLHRARDFTSRRLSSISTAYFGKVRRLTYDWIARSMPNDVSVGIGAAHD